MKRPALFPLATLAIVACSDGTAPTEPMLLDHPAPSPAVSAANGGYTIVDLQTLGGNQSEARDINDLDQAVGWSNVASGETHAFFWDSGVISDLGTLPGATSSDAWDINDAGQVVGLSPTPSSSPSPHAFLKNPGQPMIDLSALAGFDCASSVRINEAGEVVVSADNCSTMRQSFYWSPSTGPVDLGSLGGFRTNGVAINDAGQIVGTGLTAASQFHAFIWDLGSGIHDLGTLGGNRSFASGINAGGKVVGGSLLTGGSLPNSHAFLWTAGGGMVDLGIPAGGDFSLGENINSSDQISGGWRPAGSGNTRGFIWDSGIMTDLGSVGFSTDPRDLNEAGQIVGVGSTVMGSRAWIWETGTITDLGTLPGTNTGSAASAVNESSVVAGVSSSVVSGQIVSRAVIWQPPGGPSEIEVQIDIKPGSDPNSINCKNDTGVIAVAVLTTEDFDATTVDHTTVTFEGASETHADKKTGLPRVHAEDVDGDGDTDLVFHFRLGDTNLTCASTEGQLGGETLDGQPILGVDSVRMVGRR
ncbi:MAG: hypothetical protein ACYSUI_13610 [Planctomycetota bacterium]|jgi:probable HAF family extracellular repeat protein